MAGVDMCLNVCMVKPGFFAAAGALDQNGDGQACKSENPQINDADFATFVNLIRTTPEVKSVPVLALPKMVDVPVPDEISPGNIRIMQAEVTARLFNQVMEGSGYKITGHNADKLQATLEAALKDPSKANNALTGVSLEDAREFAKRLSYLTCRKFRLPNMEEMAFARSILNENRDRSILLGDHWTWTETPVETYSDRYITRHIQLGDRNVPPLSRMEFTAIRLVEDL